VFAFSIEVTELSIVVSNAMIPSSYSISKQHQEALPVLSQVQLSWSSWQDRSLCLATMEDVFIDGFLS